MTEQQDPAVMMLPKVRISFAHLEKPHAPPNSTDAKYGADLLLDPSLHADVWAQLSHIIQQLAVEKWKDMAPAILYQINADPKLRGYGAGDARRNKKDMSILEGYQGMTYITAKNAQQPDLIDQNGKAIDPSNALAQQAGVKKPYGGCYVNALIRVWLQDNQYGRGVRFDLLAVQFAADGASFGPGQVETEGYFSKIEGAPEPVAPPGGFGVGGFM